MCRRLFFRIPLWAMLAFMLTGMGPGCTQSEIPLSSREDGFVDEYLVGEWYDATISEEGVIQAEASEDVFVFTDDGQLWIDVTDEEGTSRAIYDLWSTRLGANTYLNLRIVDCPRCTEEQQQAIADWRCPFHILRYFTYLPEDVAIDDMAEERRQRLAADFERMRGDLIVYQFMADDFVSEAIAAGDLAGQEDCEDCAENGACIDAEQSELREFVAEHDANLFDEEWAGILVRRPTIAWSDDGLPIGMARSRFLNWLRVTERYVVTRMTETTVMAVGPRVAGTDGQVAVFNFESDKLTGGEYQTIEMAPPLHRAALGILRPRHIEGGRYAAVRWRDSETGRVAINEAPEHLALRECISELEQAPENQHANEHAAAGLITACMQAGGWHILVTRDFWRHEWPACVMTVGWWYQEDAGAAPEARSGHEWIPEHRACMDDKSRPIVGRFIETSSDEPLLVSDVLINAGDTLRARDGYEFTMHSRTRAAAVQTGNADRPIVGTVGCAATARWFPEDHDTPKDTWCRVEIMHSEDGDQLRCVYEEQGGVCMFHIDSDADSDAFGELILPRYKPTSDLDDVVVTGDEEDSRASD